MRAALVLTSVLLLGGCSRPPAAYLAVRRLDGPRPQQLLLRCRVDGLKPPIKYVWRVAPEVRPIFSADEPTLLVQLGPTPVAPWAECTATAEDKVTARAARALASPTISASPSSAQPGQLLTVRGSGFGPARDPSSAIYFVPGWGRARAADHECKGASWSDAAISACVPRALAAGQWQLRVQAVDELAIARAPVVVAAAAR